MWVGQPWLRRGVDVLTRDRSDWWALASSSTLQAIIASRLIVWVAGLSALAIFGRNPSAISLFDANGASAPFHSAVANFLLAPAARWDSVWYLQIAHAGYFSQQSSAMFPLYPLLIRIGSVVVHSELLAGLAISLASMTLGLYLLDRLVRLDFDQATARTTVLLIAFFPVAFFLSSVYTESLYLLLSVGALYAARQERWALAGVCGALAAATRSDGILLMAPLILIYLYGPRANSQLEGTSGWWRPRYPVRPSAGWIALIPVGLAAYLAYLGIAHGQPFAPYHAEQIYWNRHFAGPFGAVAQTILRLPNDITRVVTGTGAAATAGDPISWNAHDLFDLAFLAFALVGLISARRRVPFPYLTYSLLSLAAATSYPFHYEPLASLARYMLVIFPVFIGWALLLNRRPRMTLVVLGTSATLLAVFSGLWATWAWIA